MFFQFICKRSNRKNIHMPSNAFLRYMCKYWVLKKREFFFPSSFFCLSLLCCYHSISLFSSVATNSGFCWFRFFFFTRIVHFRLHFLPRFHNERPFRDPRDPGQPFGVGSQHDPRSLQGYALSTLLKGRSARKGKKRNAKIG